MEYLLHERQRNYKCNSCGKSFTTSGYLKTHVKTIHDGKKDHECEFCDRSFAMAGDLKRHIKQSTSQW